VAGFSFVISPLSTQLTQRCTYRAARLEHFKQPTLDLMFFGVPVCPVLADGCLLHRNITERLEIARDLDDRCRVHAGLPERGELRRRQFAARGGVQRTVHALDRVLQGFVQGLRRPGSEPVHLEVEVFAFRPLKVALGRGGSLC